MSQNPCILIVEDEQVIINFLRAVLDADGYRTLHAKTGNEAVLIAASYCPDLMLLDLGLPDMDGGTVLKEVREWSDMPIIVVSARQDEKEKVAALDAGANDYVTKPFGNNELLARIRTAIRHHNQMKNGGARENGRFTAGLLSIDYERRTVTMDGAPVHLTPIEYKIVVLLSISAGRVVTHDHILREIWGPYAGDSQVLRVNMANIRRKLEPEPADPRYILTEVGVGYRMIE